MSELGAMPAAGPAPVGTVSFEAQNVTETDLVSVSGVPASLPASAVAESLAARMSLPQNEPWALREDSTGAYLDDDKPIGEQIQPGARVTVTPRGHLGLGVAA